MSDPRPSSSTTRGWVRGLVALVLGPVSAYGAGVLLLFGWVLVTGCTGPGDCGTPSPGIGIAALVVAVTVGVFGMALLVWAVRPDAASRIGAVGFRDVGAALLCPLGLVGGVLAAAPGVTDGPVVLGVAACLTVGAVGATRIRPAIRAVRAAPSLVE